MVILSNMCIDNPKARREVIKFKILEAFSKMLKTERLLIDYVFMKRLLCFIESVTINLNAAFINSNILNDMMPSLIKLLYSDKKKMVDFSINIIFNITQIKSEETPTWII